MQEGKYEWAGHRDSGDCSLRILKSNLVYDDGEWECQVRLGRLIEPCLALITSCQITSSGYLN